MANLCFNVVKLIGEKDILEKLQQQFSATKYLEEVQKRIDFKCEGWGRTYDAGIESANIIHKDDEDILEIIVSTAWGPVDEYWSALSEKYDLKWCAWSEVDGEYMVVNDLDRKYFPEDYVMYTETDCEFFPDNETTCYTANDMEKVIQHISKTNKNLSINTVDDIEEYLSETGYGALYKVERYSF